MLVVAKVLKCSTTGMTVTAVHFLGCRHILCFVSIVAQQFSVKLVCMQKNSCTVVVLSLIWASASEVI